MSLLNFIMFAFSPHAWLPSGQLCICIRLDIHLFQHHEPVRFLLSADESLYELARTFKGRVIFKSALTFTFFWLSWILFHLLWCACKLQRQVSGGGVGTPQSLLCMCIASSQFIVCKDFYQAFHHCLTSQKFLFNRWLVHLSTLCQTGPPNRLAISVG